MSTLHFKDSELEIHKVVVGPMDNNVFVLRCRQSGEGLLIDAANEHELLLDLCKNLNVQQVIETHGHWDHIQAVPQVRDAGYSVHITQADAHMLDSYDEILEDDCVISVGRIKLETILTPGHTPGSVSFHFDSAKLLVAGDTLFQGSVGRTDLPGGDFKMLKDSIQNKIYSLDEATNVITGHGPETTIRREMESNLFIRHDS